jgi:hypothetical protein
VNISGTVANAPSSVAIGSHSLVSADSSVAIGAYAQVETNNSVAIGDHSIASDPYTVSIGNSNNQRKLVQVANFGQLIDAGLIKDSTGVVTNAFVAYKPAPTQ